MNKSTGLTAMFLSMLGSISPEKVLNERIEKVREFKKTQPKRYGSRFEINGVEIYALNRKNAERKYNNLMKKQ